MLFLSQLFLTAAPLLEAARCRACASRRDCAGSARLIYSNGPHGRVIQPKLAILNAPSEIFDVTIASVPSLCRPFLAGIVRRAVLGAQAVVGIRICHFFADSVSLRLLDWSIRSSHHLVECPALPADCRRRGCLGVAKIARNCQTEQ